MIAKRLWKNILSLCLLCQFAVFPFNSVLTDTKPVNISVLNHSVLIISIYKQYPDKNFWLEAVLRDEFEKQISLLYMADIQRNDGS